MVDRGKGGGRILHHHYWIGSSPPWMKFKFNFKGFSGCYRRGVRGAHPSIPAAGPLSKLPLHVNSCYPGARQAVQCVVHPFHIVKELLLSPLPPHPNPRYSPLHLSLFLGKAIMSEGGKQCGFGSRALLRQVSQPLPSLRQLRRVKRR